jgi:hypothetical protein
LVWLDTSQEPARFWVLQWHPTLFGDVVLVEVQGRIGRPTRARVLQHADHPELDVLSEAQVRRHLANGYQLIDWS